MAVDASIKTSLMGGIKLEVSRSPPARRRYAQRSSSRKIRRLPVVDREERSRQRMLSSRRRFVALGTVAPACAEAALPVFGLRLPVAVGIP